MKKIYLLILFCVFYLSLSTVAAINETDTSISNNPIAIDENSCNSSIQNYNTIEITQDNYNNYFNQYTGEIKPGAHIKDGDVLKIGNISNHAFVIDRKLTLMPISPTDQIVNGFIHLVKGSDYSTITNLTINNTGGILSINSQDVGMLHGIWLSDTNYINISYNVIRIANTGGVYAIPIHNSNHNIIVGNDMKTWITSNIIMADSNYNLISRNRIEVLSYSDLSVTNLIYYSPFAFAGRLGSSQCLGNTITYNNLIGFSTMPMSIIIQAIYENNVNTTIAHNLIYKGSYGINLCADNAFVYNNTVNNSAIGIVTNGSNISVINNTVSGLSQRTGIIVSGTKNSNDVASGNNITFRDVSRAFVVGDYVDAYNNIINIEDYGVGISITGNYSKTYNNRIKTSRDDAIQFLANNVLIEDNTIITNARGISITTANLDRFYNNTISKNKITSDNYAIFLKGLVYNTTISNNVIESNTSGIYKDITDELSDNNYDNIINGVIHDATALIVNDNNFHEYFDENGYLNYTFGKGKSNSLIFTFLSNKDIILDRKINVISNKMENLLFNVSITFLEGSSESLIRDLNFVNYNKNAIILNSVDNVNVAYNNITAIFTRGSANSAGIFVVGIGDDNIISHNNIYINSNTDYSYAISVSSYNPYTFMYNKEFSKGFVISNNNIIMITKAMGEAIFSDAIVDSKISENNINIISDGDAYGIAGVNVIGRLYNWNISNNEIIIHSKKMAYLIEVHMFDNMTIENNYIYSESNGAYGIALYNSKMINITNNEIIIIGGNLSNIKHTDDVIPAGNGVIRLSNLCENITITNNTFDTNTQNPIIVDNFNSTVNITHNYHVLSDYNYDIYFNDEYTINSEIISDEDVLSLANLTKHQLLIINKPIILLPYKNFIPSISLRLKSDSKIINMSFFNSTIYLDNTSNVATINCTFNNSTIIIVGGFDNYLLNNKFINSSEVLKLVSTYGNIIESNDFNINASEVISISNSYNNKILNNIINATSNDLKTIILSNSNSNVIEGNTLNIEAFSIFGIYLSNSSYNEIISNNIFIAGKSMITNQSAILIKDNSSNNNILNNFIISSSASGGDYAIVIINDRDLSNRIYLNYLISDNGDKRANEAVYSNYEIIEGNTPYTIYVSDEGSDISGDGSEFNPYSSISFALSKAFNHAVIKVIKGTFIESNLIIDKNITISAIDSGVVINANYSQLFTILPNGILSVNGIVFKNGFDVDGGALFKNNGSLFINNSVISNSSSYYDNSNPVFDHIVDEKSANTINCTRMGMGGAILNYGNLYINNSDLNNNFAHIGGAIADFGKTVINSSRIFSNKAVHGGAIYTDSSEALNINNSSFYDNDAIISLDYCMIHKAQSSWSIDEGYGYTYTSLCDIPLACGGAIFTGSTDLIISNTSFTKNYAWKGGAIGSKFVSSSSRIKLPASILLSDCLFEENRATNSILIKSGLMGQYPYNSEYSGGAIYGAFESFYSFGTEFLSNQAGIDNAFSGDGGALKVQSNNGVIDLCKFISNRAGVTGGALDISNNFIITRTIISNNSAMYGGAINYQSYTYYNHVQDNLNIYNSTISDNMALNSGGAFRIGQSNVTVHNCNIYGNTAPEGSTMATSYYGAGPDRVYADMRFNYWGTNEFGKVLGADNSVYNFPNVVTGRKLNNIVNWVVASEDNGDNPSIPVNPSGSDNNPGNMVVNPGSTKPGSGTNSAIGSKGDGNGGGAIVSSNGDKPNSGNNWGDGDGENWGDGGSSSSSNRNASSMISDFDSSNVFEGSSEGSNSNGGNNQESDTRGNSNSSNSFNGNFESDLTNINNTNYGQSSSSTQSSDSGGSAGSASDSSSGASSAGKAYEIKEDVAKQVDTNINIISYGLVFIIVFALLIFGYKRKEEEE